MKAKLNMVKVNLRNSRTAYLIIGIMILLGLANCITTIIFSGQENNSIGNYLYLLPLFMSIFIPAQNLKRFMRLGAKRSDFFFCCILTYIPVCAAVTAISIISYFTVDKFMLKYIGILELLKVFGFMEHGFIVAFFQMTAFLIMFSCVLHTLTLVQGKWYGWVADILIIAIISVFTPIAPLRASLVWFFNMLIFHDVAVTQILCCLVFGAAVYYASLAPIKKCV